MKRMFILAALLAFACRSEKPYPMQELDEYRAARVASLKKEDGWLTLVGLHWLKEGANTFGSAEGNNIKMPAKAPESLGKLVLMDGKVTLDPASDWMRIDGKPVTAATELLPDTDEKGPTTVDAGLIRFYVIKRAEKFGLRVRDRDSQARAEFQDLEYFPTEPKWRVEARFEPYNPPKQIPITNIVGQTTPNPSPGALVFEVDGKEYRLDPISERSSSGDLFIIFSDQTTGRETYGGGRYLYAESPKDGSNKVIVDFNKAYNPPCVFTPFATCPLPPAQNKLPVRVEAGEKKFSGKHA